MPVGLRRRPPHAPVDVTISFNRGDLALYPLDTYRGELIVTVERIDGSLLVPTATSFQAFLHGMRVDAAFATESEWELADVVVIDLSRATALAALSFFVTLVMWAVTSVAVLLFLSIVWRRRKVELAMFTFLSALMFAFPALRNVQPGVPSMGVLTDYVAFFWAEAIIAAMLISLVIVWLRRPAA